MLNFLIFLYLVVAILAAVKALKHYQAKEEIDHKFIVSSRFMFTIGGCVAIPIYVMAPPLSVWNLVGYVSLFFVIYGGILIAYTFFRDIVDEPPVREVVKRDSLVVVPPPQVDSVEAKIVEILKNNRK